MGYTASHCFIHGYKREDHTPCPECEKLCLIGLFANGVLVDLVRVPFTKYFTKPRKGAFWNKKLIRFAACSGGGQRFITDVQFEYGLLVTRFELDEPIPYSMGVQPRFGRKGIVINMGLD